MGYDYYEFRSLDRELTDQEREELDTLCSRSEASPTGISFEYNYSSFGSDPRELVERYFDIGLYLSKYGERRLLLRFPSFDSLAERWRRYAVPGAVAIDASPPTLVDVEVDSEELGGWVSSGEGWMDDLVSLREELLDGDLRPLYLFWLAGIGSLTAEYEPNSPEPPVPPGLDQLTPSQEAVCDFFGLDQDLLAPALQVSGPRTETEGPDWQRAVEELPPADQQSFLVRLAEGDTGVRADLRERLRRDLDTTPLDACQTTDRTVDDYWDAVHRLSAERARREAEERRREHEAHLKDVWADRDGIWEDVIELIETKETSNYDVAVDKLADLQQAAEHFDAADSFADNIAFLRERYSRLHGLKRRMSRAGLPE